jgi:predicted nuclease of predicted toxin-antitoxin system
MPDRIRFHLDEHVDPDVARALRRYGIDVTTTFEAGLRAQSDAAQWAYVMAEQRVLVTHDADFLRIANRGEDHPGVAFCGKTTRTVGEMVRRLILVYEVLTAEDIRGRVEYL